MCMEALSAKMHCNKNSVLDTKTSAWKIKKDMMKKGSHNVCMNDIIQLQNKGFERFDFLLVLAYQ